MNRYQYQLPPLYFLHIPKTAGTSLKYWLADFYGHHEQLYVDSLESLERVTRQKINQSRLVAGHLRWQMFHYFDVPRLSMTWLRDPVNRAISNFLFNRQNFPMLMAQAESLGQSGWIEYYQECQKHTLAQMIDRGIYVGYLDNIHIRHLTDCFPENSEPKFIDDSVLEQAKQNLESLSFVGICEWMDQSIDLCCYRLGFPYHPMRMNLNTTSAARKPQMDAADREKLEHVERFDRKLYEHARRRFERQFLEFWQQAASFSQALIQPGECETPLEFLNQLKNRYRQPEIETAIGQCISHHFATVRSDIPLVEEAELSFEDPVFLNNWHPRWIGKKPGSIIRWAGPENLSTVLLPLKPHRDYEVAFLVENHAHPQFIETMAIFVNGYPVITKTKLVNRVGLVWFLIPREVIRDQRSMTEIAIRVSGEIPPSSIDGGLKVSFSASGFWFRVSARETTLAQSWLSDFERSGRLPNAPAKVPAGSSGAAHLFPSLGLNVPAPSLSDVS